MSSVTRLTNKKIIKIRCSIINTSHRHRNIILPYSNIVTNVTITYNSFITTVTVIYFIIITAVTVTYSILITTVAVRYSISVTTVTVTYAALREPTMKAGNVTYSYAPFRDEVDLRFKF